jgi:hypothetical protein
MLGGIAGLGQSDPILFHGGKLMSNPVVTSPAEHAEPPKSFVERFIGVFISPGETFADIARKPDFIAPMITCAIAISALFDTMYWKVGMETMTRITLEHSMFASHLPPEAMEKAISDSAGHLTRTLIITPIFITVAMVIVLLIYAGLGILFVNAIFGGEVKFKTLLSVVAFANLVAVPGHLLALPIILFGGTDNLDPQNPVPFNVAFFLNSKDVAKPLFALAGSVDLIPIWLVILLGIGMSAATGGKVKSLPITLCFVGGWAIWIIGKVVLAAMF